MKNSTETIVKQEGIGFANKHPKSSKQLSTKGYPTWVVEGDVKGWYEILSYFTSRKEARDFRKEVVDAGYANKAHVRRVQVNIIA